MTVISLINYREITTLAELKALFQNNVVSIDFEFTPSTFEPFAYGYCLDKRVKGFRFSHLKGTDRTKQLPTITYQGFYSSLVTLADQDYRHYIVYGPNDYKCFYKLYERKKNPGLRPFIFLYNIQPCIGEWEINNTRGAASLRDAANLVGIDVSGFVKHNPKNDAELLYKLAKNVANMSEENFLSYKNYLAGMKYPSNMPDAKNNLEENLASEQRNSFTGDTNIIGTISEIKDELARMHSLITRLKIQETKKDAKKKTIKKVPKKPEAQKLFIDEVIFQFPPGQEGKIPDCIVIHHRNATKVFKLGDEKSVKKAKKKKKLKDNIKCYEQLKARYMGQEKAGIKIVLIVQKFQYNSQVKTFFETLMDDILSEQSYAIVEV